MERPLIQLSRLWLYAKVRQFEGTPLSEDSGAYIRDVFKVMARWGCPAEALYPYDTTKYDMVPPAELDTAAEEHKISLYYRCPDLSTIKASISQGFPVVGGFDCPENLFSLGAAKTGIVLFPTSNEKIEGGHAVLFVGYDDGYEGGCLEFMNSWGTGWGQDGFGYLPYAFVNRGLADDFWTARL